uniref:WGS project CBMI000000000 data, contig CS3069_c000978 n=1 Tax=Fusarium clavum TaxID=2594811 RepID=A0A090MB58_9HYPO|nr:unnamed protein product [Fusarium clavum]
MASAQCQLKCALLMPGAIPPDAANGDVFVNITNKGIQLSFPRDPDRSVWSWYSPDLELTDSNMHRIMIELPPDGFQEEMRPLTDDEMKNFELIATHSELKYAQILTLALDDSCSPNVTGYGTPFHGMNATVDAWINQDAPICGVAALSQILKATKFTLLVLATDNEIQSFVQSFKTAEKPEAYGFGDIHTWDMQRYGQQIPERRGPTFPPTVRFENANERDTAFTQIHVQDVWDFDKALKEITEMEIPALI